MEGLNNCEQLPISNGVILLCGAQGAGEESDSSEYLQAGRVSLSKDSSQGILRCIHFQFELSVLIGGNKNGAQGDNIDKKIDGFSAFICPDELGIGF